MCKDAKLSCRVIPKAPRDDPEITALSQRQLIVSPHHICPRSSRNFPARSPRPACRGSGGLRTSNHRSWKGQPAIAAMWPVMPSRRAYRSRRKMMHPAQRSLARKALPAVAVAVAVLVTRLLGPSGDIPFILFLAAVFLSAWYGGLGPALTAVVLSLLAVYSFFVPPHSDLDMGGNLASRSVRFVLVSGLLIWLTESRRRAEEALRESEERFRGTFENADVGIAHHDLEGRFLRVNQKFCEILGYTREELLGRPGRTSRFPRSSPQTSIGTPHSFGESGPTTRWKSALSARTARSSGSVWPSRSSATRRVARVRHRHRAGHLRTQAPGGEVEPGPRSLGAGGPRL